jgi:hypothetical protein
VRRCVELHREAAQRLREAIRALEESTRHLWGGSDSRH